MTDLPSVVNLPQEKTKVKKTLEDLLVDGQVKTGRDVLDEKARQVKALEEFTLAALEEARMQQRKKR